MRVRGFAITVAVAVTTATWALAASKVCTDFLPATDRYSCTVTPFSGTRFHDCFTIAAGTGQFALLTNTLNGGVHDGCVCDATGRAKNPKLESSPSAFTCVPVVGGTAFSGKVASAGKKLVHGNAVDSGAHAFAFDCILDPTCTP